MWKEITINPNYLVSDDGRVKNTKTGGELKPLITAEGYRTVFLGRGMQARVHRLVAAAFLPAPLPGQDEVAHNDGTRSNNTATNLRWATKAENQRDRLHHGTHSRGERGHGAKFTDEQAAEMRNGQKYAELNNSALGRLLGVSHETIRAARSGATYRAEA